jgi:hypothetical protein
VHQEPPEVASLCSPLVLAVGADVVLKPALLLVLFFVLVVFLVVVVLLAVVVLPVVVVLLVVVVSWVVEPGSASATAPAARTLVAPTAAVAARTLAWPRALAATARPILSRFMRFILGPAVQNTLWPGSQKPLTGLPPEPWLEVIRRT